MGWYPRESKSTLSAVRHIYRGEEKREGKGNPGENNRHVCLGNDCELGVFAARCACICRAPASRRTDERMGFALLTSINCQLCLTRYCCCCCCSAAAQLLATAKGYAEKELKRQKKNKKKGGGEATPKTQAGQAGQLTRGVWAGIGGSWRAGRGWLMM